MAVLTVGTGQQYASLSAAVAASHDGDTIYVQAGTYYDDTSEITTKISIIGVGGMANFVATKPLANGKAILITDTNVTIDHLAFSGATDSSGNGAGIRYQGGTLTITNSYFHNNQDGLLAAPDPTGIINIDHSEFAYNGVGGSGQTHNIYVNTVGTFSFTNSYSHDANQGHELKSRASNTIITNDRFDDGNSTASYSIDLPDGGNAIIENNFIRQGPNSGNPAIIAYDEETTGAGGPDTQLPNSSLLVSGNTIDNELTAHTPIGVWNTSTITASITGNQFYGLTSAEIATGPNTQSNNVTLTSEPAINTSDPWAASPWSDLISDTSGAGVLTGTSGNDLFVGGAAADRFVAGSGQDSIANFTPGKGDTIDLTAFPAFQTLANVSGNAVQNGADTTINLGNGNSLDLMNISLATLVASDFIFSVTTTPRLIETSGNTSLAQVGSNYFLYATGTSSGPELYLQGAPVNAGQTGNWTPIGAEKTASGYEVAWKVTGADQYTIWNTDSNGAYTSDTIGVVSGSSAQLEAAETLFQQDLNGDGHIGLALTVIEALGQTTLATDGTRFYLDDSSGDLGPTIKLNGGDVIAGQTGNWTPIGAEKTASGYEVAWKVTGADQYTIWNTDSNGAYTSDTIGVVSGSNAQLEAAETLFQQDLNGDGHIGLALTVIEALGQTTLATDGTRFYLDDSSGDLGPTLKLNGGDVIAGQTGNWTPIGAEKTASGYEVAWKVAGADQYTIWNTDSNGAYASDSIGVVSGSNPQLEAAETLFQQDLNGDGHIGLTVIQADGQTTLATDGTRFYLEDSNDISSGLLGPTLNLNGGDVIAGQTGNWAPIGAVQTASGYEVAWKMTGADQYTIWNTDSNGAYTSDTIGVVSGANAQLEAAETLFQQDLNGDGYIGLAPPLT